MVEGGVVVAFQECSITLLLIFSGSEIITKTI